MLLALKVMLLVAEVMPLHAEVMLLHAEAMLLKCQILIANFFLAISIISITFNISFSYISTLNLYHELIKCLVIYELDVRCKFQGSGDATSCTCVG